MKTLEYLEWSTDPFEVVISQAAPANALNIAGVYEDTTTREWAVQSYLRAAQLAGEESVQKNWYDVHALSDPAVLMEAIRSALRADVIVVSVYAAEELPLNLYVWVTAWLPRRLSRAGAMAALVGVDEPQRSHSARTIKYLRAVARRAQLEFAPQARRRTGPSCARAVQSQEIPQQLYFPYTLPGLNG